MGNANHDMAPQTTQEAQHGPVPPDGDTLDSQALLVGLALSVNDVAETLRRWRVEGTAVTVGDLEDTEVVLRTALQEAGVPLAEGFAQRLERGRLRAMRRRVQGQYRRLQLQLSGLNDEIARLDAVIGDAEGGSE